MLVAVLALLLGWMAGPGLAPPKSIAATTAAPPAPAASAAHTAASPAASGTAAPGTRPERPPTVPGSGVQLDLVSIGPAALAPGATLTVEVNATNATGTALTSPTLSLTTNTARVTERSALEAWERDTDADPQGRAVAASGSDAAALEPGQSRTFTVSIAADALGYSTSPGSWGARRVALTLASRGTPQATLRTFVVWRPPSATAAVDESVLLPVAAADPGHAATDPAAYDTSLTQGRMAATRQLALRPDVDWLLDPSLLAPPSLPSTAETTAPAASTMPTTAGASATPTSTVPQTFAPSGAAKSLAADLVGHVGERTVLTLPYAQADLVSLDAAGAADLREVIHDRGQAALTAAGIVSSGTVARVAASEADGESLTAAQATGADVLMTSSASLRADPEGEVTPSSVGSFSTSSGSTTVLAPDPVLSDEFGALSAGTDTEQTTQRLLAETAVIASEPSAAPRHVLIFPGPDAVLDPAAAGRTLDALDAAPWLHPSRTADLLDTGSAASWTDDPGESGHGDYALGTLTEDDVQPSGITEDGIVARRDDPSPLTLLDGGAVRSVQGVETGLEPVRAAMTDPHPTDVADLAAISAVSERWRADPDGMRQRESAAAKDAQSLEGRIGVVPASNYTLLASGASVPITLTNDLDSAVRVRLAVAADKPLVRLPSTPPTVDIPARGRITASVPLTAVANGDVVLSVALHTTDGRALTSPRDATLTVNPAWENWTTMTVVIAMGLLVVIGVLRARRHGSDRRAPAVRGPEDPATLARTGVSAPAKDLAPDPAPVPSSCPEPDGPRAEDGPTPHD